VLTLLRVHEVTTELLPAWTSTFTDHIPTELASYIQKSTALISDFGETAEDNHFGADLDDALEIPNDHILRTENLLRNQTESAFEDVRKSMQTSHRLAVPVVRAFLESMYAQCVAEGGKSAFP
jgi:hypothetical protein